MYSILKTLSTPNNLISLGITKKFAKGHPEVKQNYFDNEKITYSK